MELDEILYEDEHRRFEIQISTVDLVAARNKIKKLNEIGATNVYLVNGNSKSRNEFYNYCRRNKLPYGTHYDGRRKSLMTPEQYLLFSLAGIEHRAQLHEQLTNQELLTQGLLNDIYSKL